jgi:hypothetical protein
LNQNAAGNSFLNSNQLGSGNSGLKIGRRQSSTNSLEGILGSVLENLSGNGNGNAAGNGNVGNGNKNVSFQLLSLVDSCLTSTRVTARWTEMHLETNF